MEVILGLIFWGLVIYYFVKRSKRKKLEQGNLSNPLIINESQPASNKGKKLSRKKKIVFSAVGIFLALYILGLIVGPPPKKVNEEVVVAEVETPIKVVEEKDIQITTINERDTSFAGRKRGQFEVYAPDAITKDEREKVLKDVAKKYADQGYQYFDIRIVPVDDPEYTTYFGNFANATYDVDGCGPSGRDCGKDKWRMKVSDYVLTNSNKAYMNSFIKNHKAILYDFNRDPDNWTAEKQEQLDKEFEEAIAKDLGVEPDDIPVFMIF